VPDYILDIAQKRAGTYYQDKYHLTKEAKAGQHFTGGPRKFEPTIRMCTANSQELVLPL
jgi:hypothetical protein